MFLIFDALLMRGQNIMGMSLPDRLKCIQNDVVAPFKELLIQKDNDTKGTYPFNLDIKKMWKPYAIAEILELEIPKLQHGNDGLIFTPVSDPYGSGTCERLLKWKPSELNSVDFKLVIHRDAPEGQRFELQVATSRGMHRTFAFYREPDAVEKLNDLDGQIIECRYFDKDRWSFLRIRRDKTTANNERVVTKILDSIKDNVTAAELIERIPAIRRAWKAREVSKSATYNAKRTKI